jgi:hypothetical protein
VGTLAGVCLHALVWERRPKAALALAGPCAALMAGTLVAGGANYRANVLDVPALASIGLRSTTGTHYPFTTLLQSLLLTPLVWVYPLLLALGRGRAAPTARVPAGDGTRANVSCLAVPAVVSALWCVFAVFREGSAKNTLLEGFLNMGALAAVLLLNRIRQPGRRAAWLETVGVPAVLVGMALYPLAQCVFLDRIGNLTVDTPEGYARRAAFVEQLRGLPKPIFVEDSMLSLPWFTADNQYPAYCIDVFFMTDARVKGWYVDGGFDALARERACPTLLLKHGLISRRAAEAAGYRRVPFPAGVDPLGFTLYRLPAAGEGPPLD